MASGPLTVQLRINADGSAAIVGLRNVQGALDNTGQAARRADGVMASLAGSLKGLAVTAGAALSVSALASSFMSANREAGLLRASLETVTGSVAKATTAWEVLQGFAAQTPYSLEQAVQGFIKLKSMGLDPSMAALTSYGNTAGAMGKSLNQMIEAVADAATGEFERLKEFGIKAKQNGDEVSLTFQGVTTTIGNNAQAIEKYLLDLGNVQFAGGMERQAKTLEGSISNLGDAWDQFWVKMGDTGLTQGVIAVLNDVSSGIASLGDGMTGANGVARGFGDTMASLGAGIATTYNELKTGVWSDTTTAIAATAGAIGGAIGLMTALSAAVGIATGVWGVFTAILLANPITLAIAGIGALIGVLYTLRDETITIGQTTTTVGATVSAVWETTASYSQAAWDTFSSYVSGVFNSLPPVVSAAGNAVLSVWSATMSGLMSITSGAINYVMNLFRWIGQSAGVLAGEVAMSMESGFSFDRLKEGLSGAVQYTDMLGEASARASAGIAAAGQEIEKKAGAIAADNLETELGSVVTAEHANQQRKAAMAAKLHAFEQDNLAGAHGKAGAGAKAGADATKGAGAANNAAAKAAKDYASELDALIKKYLPARDDAENLAEATAVLDKAMAKGDITGTEYGEMLKKLKKDYDTAGNAAEDLIDKYDREGAAARTLAEDSDGLNKIIAEGGPAAERAKVALEELGKQQAKNTDEANAWSEVWKNAVKRIDDTFAGLWKDLFSGTKSTLESMKDAIASWLAEVAHALLTKPLVVAITTAMTGGSTATQAAGAVGQAASGASGLGGLGSFSSIGSMFSTAFSLGSTFLSGVAEGITGMFTTNMFSTLSTAWGAATSGSAMGAAAGAGVITAYALPLVAAGALILNKYFKDQEPRTGAYGATTTGRTDQFEDEVGVKGGFGLTFGMNDMGTANVDAEEMRKTFEGFAAVSTALADFYGKDVSSKVEASLKQASMENWGKNGLMNYAMNAEQAFQIAFTDIITHAAATGDAVAVVMSSVVGSLQGTMEDMANQIERGMLAAKAAVGMAEAFQGQETGDRLGLADKDTTGNALKLVEYAKAMQEAGETTAEAMGRMALNLGVFDAALALTGTTTDATGQAFVDLANNLAGAANDAGIGMEGLMKLQDYYYDQFYSTTEKATKAMQELLKGINKEWPKLQEKMLGINKLDQLAIEIPALKESVKDLDTTIKSESTSESFNITQAMRDMYPHLRAPLQEAPPPKDTFTQEMRDWVKANYPKAWMPPPAAPTSEELEQAAIDAFYEMFTHLKGPNERVAEEADTGVQKDYQAEANAALRAAEMYAYGVANGTITQNTETEARIQAALMSYADELKAMGYDVTQGVLAVADQIKNWGQTTFMSEQDRQSLAKDPNAEIYAKLVNDMPKSRDEFEKLIGQIDVTTESGALLYAEIMKLVPGFDAMFDSIEGFEKWLGVTDETALATKRLEKVFSDMGLAIPSSKQALLDLYESGTLTAEQMAILGQNLTDLGLIFPDVVDAVADAVAAIVDLTNLHIRLARTLGDEGMAGWLERQQELASAGDDASRAMLLMIYAAEDLAKQVGKDGQKPNFNTVLLTALGREMGKGFANFDPNGDQATTPAELATALGDLVGGEELTKLMASLDKNSDGQLSVLEQLPLLIAANLAPLFEQFDTNKDGGLSLDELRTSLNGVVDETQLQAIYDLLDVNGDGLVDKLEAVRLSLYTSMRDIVSAVDTTGDKQLSPEELRKTFKNAADPEAMLKRVYDILDRNQDGLINALEAIPLSIAGGLADKFALIDTSGDLQLSFDELKAAYGDMASDDQLTDLIRLADLNGDGQISAQEAGNLKLDLIALKADKLSDVVQAIRDQETSFMIGIHDVETAITTGLDKLASGLGITDSAKSAALGMPLNLIQEEAGNSIDLRLALQELRSELQALRQSQERTETNRQTEATAMQNATANLGSAVASIPERIEVVVPALAGEAGY